MPPQLKVTGGEELHGDIPWIGQTIADIERRRAWESWRFGAFVHWGPSALLGGWRDGEPVPGLAEWIQSTARIPREEYRALAAQFDPIGFDADEWVRLIVGAGARYLVFTAKHHDGFSMYHSTVSDFNIVDATRFGRDPLAELAAACRRHGIALGFYYSHMIDWAEPDAVGPRGNDWDFDPAEGVFERYWRRKAIPQLTELLTGYGDIASVWFDMPAGIDPGHAAEASALVRRLQPDAVINSRLGGGSTPDYLSMDDNYFNAILPMSAWETAATTNDSWGYASGERVWKTSASLCETIAFAVSRGGNLLLNLGPDGEGRIPPEAGAQFLDIGRWMRRDESAIREAGRSPFPTGFDWGYITSHGTTLFAHVTHPSRDAIALPGLRTAIVAAHHVQSVGRSELVRISPSPDDAEHNAPIIAGLLDPIDELPRVVRIELAGLPQVDPVPVQASQDSLRLDLWAADDAPDDIAWSFDLTTTGDYRIVLLSKETSGHASPRWDGEGLTGRLEWVGPDGIQLAHDFTVHDDGREQSPVLFFWQIVRSVLRTVTVAAPGRHMLRIRGLKIADSKWTVDSLNLVAVRLEPRS